MRTRRLALWGGIATAVAVTGVALLLLTDAGAGLVTRAVLQRLNSGLAGTVTVGTVRGPIARGLQLGDLTVRDMGGTVRARAQAVELRYRLRDVLARQFVVRQLVLTAPEVDLVQERPGERPALLDIVARPTGAGPSGTVVELRDVTVVDAALLFHLPQRAGAGAAPARAADDDEPRYRRFEGMNAVFPRVRINTAGGAARTVFVEIATFSGRLSDSSVVIDAVSGRVEMQGDSVTVDLPAVRLPASRLAMAGWAVVRDSVRRFDVTLQDVDIVTDELRPVLPTIPAGLVGRGDLRVRSLAAGMFEVATGQFAVQSADSTERVGARLAMEIGTDGQWVQRNTRLTIENVDLERIRGFVDTLPVAGRVSGVIVIDGARERFRVEVDGMFRDSLARGWPVSTVRANGQVSLDDSSAPVFTQFRVDGATVDLASVRRVAPIGEFDGTLAFDGVVDGPWRALRATGTLRHRRGRRGASALRGTLRIDTRARFPEFWADIGEMSLQADALRALHPELGTLGPLTGRARVSGRLDSLTFDGRVGGALGEVAARGAAALSPERRALTGVSAEVRRLSLAALRRDLPASDLNGSLAGEIVVYPPADRRWQVHGTMQRSSVRETQLDSAVAVLAGSDSMIRVDTLDLAGAGFRAAGSGTIGMSAPRRGTVQLRLDSDSIGALEPLVAQWVKLLAADTGTTSSGMLSANVIGEGALDAYEVAATFEGQRLRRGNVVVAAARGEGTWTSSTRQLRAEVRADSLGVGDLGMRTVAFVAAGRADSLRWSSDVRFQADGDLRGAGLLVTEAGTVVVVDSLAARLGSSRWASVSAAQVAVRDSTIEFSDLTLVNTTGPGRVTLAGRVPGVVPGQLTAGIEAVSLADVVTPWGPRYAGVAGVLNGTLRLAGTAAAPTIVLDVALRELAFKTFRASLVEGEFRYADRQLQGLFTVSMIGRRLVTVDGRLPIDLALGPVERRQVQGPLDVRGTVDSLDLRALEPFVPDVRALRGTVRADVGIRGSWEAPDLRGRLTLEDGAATFPALGVRHGGVQALLELAGDTIRFDRAALSSGGGTAQVTGSVRLPELTNPLLDLQVAVRNFRLIEKRDFLTLSASGDVALRGPLFGATLTGRGVATRGVLFATDLLEKQVVNLSDTVFAAYVDTTVLREEGLGTPVSRRFVRELRVDTLRLRMGSDFWMRSGEASVQLAGELSVSKSEEEYRVNGTLNATRGVYRFLLGPAVTRNFAVMQGEIRFFGTPDLNADLDIDTQHQVRSFRGTQVTVFAHLGGTVYQPRLTLSSDVRPPLSETEIVSYLLFGAPSVQAFAGSGGTQGRFVFQQSVDRFANVLAGELESSLINGLGVPLDYLQIQPGDFSRGFSGTEIALGKQLNLFGRPAFLLASPRLCAQELVSARNVGASLEFRLSRSWLLAASVDPLHACETSTMRSLTRYQLGWDVFWERSR